LAVSSWVVGIERALGGDHTWKSVYRPLAAGEPKRRLEQRNGEHFGKLDEEPSWSFLDMKIMLRSLVGCVSWQKGFNINAEAEKKQWTVGTVVSLFVNGLNDNYVVVDKICVRLSVYEKWRVC